MPDDRVELTSGADQDLESLFTSTLERAGEDQARELLDKLEQAIASLAHCPLRRAVPPLLQSLGITEFRQMLAKPYRLLFRVVDRRVVIFLIAHEKRDFRSLLEQRLLR